jgi:hypothetical protein
MTDCLVCRLGGHTKPYTFKEFFRAFPFRHAPEAWEALAAAVSLGGVVHFRDDRHDPMKATSEVLVIADPKVAPGTPYSQLTPHVFSLDLARRILGDHANAPPLEPQKLLADQRPKQAYRLELRAAPTVESYVLVEARSPEQAMAIFENNPGRFHGEAMDALENTHDWHEMTPLHWAITSVLPHDSD